MVLKFYSRILIGTFVSVLSLTSAAQTDGVYRDKIVLRHIGPLANAVLAASNVESLNAADLYLKKVNDAGGVNGRKIVLERIDDSQDPKKTTTLATETLAQRGALAILLPRSSPSTEALMPLVQTARVPLIGPQPGTGSITDPMKPEVFAIRASFGAEVTRAIELQHTLGRTRFAFLVATDAFGNDIIKGLDVPMKKIGLVPVGVERVDNRSPDVKDAVSKLGTLQPDAIFLICAAKAASDFVKAYAAAGKVSQFIAISNSSNSGFLKDLGDKKQGVIVMQVTPSPFSPKVAIAREYRAASEAAKLPVTYQGFQAYLTAKLTVEGIKRAGKTPTSASLIAALEGMRNFDLGGFVVSYGPRERMGSKFVEATMISKDGRFIY